MDIWSTEAGDNESLLQSRDRQTGTPGSAQGSVQNHTGNKTQVQEVLNSCELIVKIV